MARFLGLWQSKPKRGRNGLIFQNMSLLNLVGIFEFGPRKVSLMHGPTDTFLVSNLFNLYSFYVIYSFISFIKANQLTRQSKRCKSSFFKQRFSMHHLPRALEGCCIPARFTFLFSFFKFCWMNLFRGWKGARERKVIG